ncbi:MAG TPA: IPT/TIG domain-containing protein [Thermoanaerobaculia bacterium]|nr:IPT/TIG domain-containing protein [Thermoanaerobaculia bacterium]
MKAIVAALLFAFTLPAAFAATQQVQLGPGLSFNPSSVNITEGDTVTWVFNAPSHTTTSDATVGPEVWDSGVVPSGNSYSHTFTTAGDYPYHCAIHSFAGGMMMNGTVHVAAAAIGPSLQNVSPITGPAAGGTNVTLLGANFTADCVAVFGNTSAATMFVNATTLNAVTPAHVAGAVNVTVNCNSGSSTLASAFTYAAAPAVPAVPTLSVLAAALAAILLGILGYATLSR